MADGMPPAPGRRAITTVTEELRMGAEIIQARYDELEAVARRFGKQAGVQAALQKRVQARVQKLRTAWVGHGSDAFFAEMDAKVFPAMQRLISALQQAQKVTLQISEIMRQAEKEVSRPFEGREQFLVPQPAEAGSSPEPGSAGDQSAEAPVPDVQGRPQLQRLLDTVAAMKPALGELLLARLRIGEISVGDMADVIDSLQLEELLDEVKQIDEAWEEAKRQYGNDSPQAQEAEQKCEDAWGNLPILGPHIKTLLDMAKANPVYSI